MNNFEKEEIPKYKKKKNSSVSRSIDKSKHKHEYKEYLLITNKDKKPHRANICKVCGKIDNVCLFDTDEVDGIYRMLSSEEVYEKYKHLEKIYVDDIYQKYIPISNEV